MLCFNQHNHVHTQYMVVLLVDYLFCVLRVIRSFQKALEDGTFQKPLHEKGSMHGTTCRAHRHV